MAKTRIEARQDRSREVRRLATEMGASGALAGLAGGAVMLLYLMLYSAFWGDGFLLPLRAIAGTFAGVRALVDGGAVVLLGLVWHFVIAAVLGIGYAAIVPRGATTFHAVLGGVAYGLFILLLMTLLITPTADPTLSARVGLMPKAWFLGHVLYGALLGLVVPLRRRVAQRMMEG